MSLSAAVTRILTLSGFPPELKTRDIQGAFNEWETERGGFKIKWVDDTTLMLVFMDAGTAKRAYLSTLLEPPTTLVSADRKIIIKPYDGPDAQAIIQNVNSRTNATRGGHAARLSVGGAGQFMMNGNGGVLGGAAAHKRAASYAPTRSAGLDVAAANAIGTGNGQREPSPTLPSLPSHPTLNSLLSSAGLGDLAPGGANGEDGMPGAMQGTPPKVGDPARRMVGHALGIRHPGLVKGDAGMKEVEQAMGGMAITAE